MLRLLIPLLTVTPLQAQPAPERRIEITSDGWRLIGDYRPPAEGNSAAVLLLPGAARDRRAYIGLSRELAARGLGVLRIDLRADGESVNLGRFEPGRTRPNQAGAERDVAAAIRWLGRQPGVDRARIGVLGASYSGESMAIAARAGAGAAAYVALSPGSLSDSSIAEIDRGGRPWWLIASRQERFARRTVDRAAAASRTAKVTIAEGTSHASDILSPHHVLEAEIADWFAGRLASLPVSPLWGPLERGGSPVGFRRTRAGSLIVDVWYPARPGGSPMRFGEYLTLADDLRGAVPGSLERTLAATVTGDSTGIDSALAARIVATPMAAVQDAPPLGRKSPLVLMTPRYATTAAQAVLGEFLASRGFVVAFPRRTDPARLPFELADDAARGAELEARIADMAEALRLLEQTPDADASALAVLAWSYTGEMATGFQLREPRVSLVIGLSTNLLAGWIYRSATQLETLDSTRLSAAYAVIGEARNPTAVPEGAFGKVTGARYFVALPGTSHGNFNALEGLLPSLFGIAAVQRWSSSGPRAIEAYHDAATMALRLLRHHLVGGSREPLADLVLRSGFAPGSTLVP